MKNLIYILIAISALLTACGDDTSNLENLASQCGGSKLIGATFTTQNSTTQFFTNCISLEKRYEGGIECVVKSDYWDLNRGLTNGIITTTVLKSTCLTTEAGTQVNYNYSMLPNQTVNSLVAID